MHRKKNQNLLATESTEEHGKIKQHLLSRRVYRPGEGRGRGINKDVFANEFFRVLPWIPWPLILLSKACKIQVNHIQLAVIDISG
ncbi:MAG: hypothetical protein WBN90_05370 [Gammaproteobacteria bacterium]